MNIYRIFTASGRYQFLVARDIDTTERIATLSGRSPDDEIPAVLPVEIVRTDDYGRALSETDLPWLTGNLPAYTQRAFDALSSNVEGYGRLISLVTSTGD